MPTGKVKWYDVEKGFGFLSREGGEDVYVRSSALPEDTPGLKAGTRVEFDIAAGRRGDQALRVRVLDAPPSEDLHRLLDTVEQSYRRGRHPDPKVVAPTAKVLRALADELELGS